MREEQERNAMFGKRRIDLLEGRLRKLEKQVEHLSKLLDPDRFGETQETHE